MAKPGIFYVICYGMVVALLATGIWAVIQTSDLTNSTSKNDNSTIGTTTPALDFIPGPTDSESSLIWLKGSNKNDYKDWTSNLMSTLEAYYSPSKLGNIKDCSYENPPGPDEVCAVNIRKWGSCIRERYFNYHSKAPCVFLKLERINGWVPEYYNDSNNLPDDMPQQLKERIKNSKPQTLNNVWISCEGESPADKEYIGPVGYYPAQGFPGYYYPSTNVDGYLSPLVAVQFQRPATGVLISIECRAWAKNIKYNKEKGSGFAHFELLID